LINQKNTYKFKKDLKKHKTTNLQHSYVDGADVQLTHLIGSPELNMHDSFLLLDEFKSSNTNDYIGGFTDHPHRDFETVSYMIAGKIRHKDYAGHEGVITPGGVQ
jgi:hypothetical protein